MNAIDLLKKQHRTVEKLFANYEKAPHGEKKEAFVAIATALVGHDAIEREIFYPACEKGIAKDVLGEALVEHGLVEFCLYRADKNIGKDALDSFVTVLKEVVTHHVKEEERDLLPKAAKALNAKKLEDLGARMEARFEEAGKTSYRKPLQAALDQLLMGRMKTTKAKASSKRAPRAPAADAP